MSAMNTNFAVRNEIIFVKFVKSCESISGHIFGISLKPPEATTVKLAEVDKFV